MSVEHWLRDVIAVAPSILVVVYIGVANASVSHERPPASCDSLRDAGWTIHHPAGAASFSTATSSGYIEGEESRWAGRGRWR
ncbi:hypothetical protein [Nocardia sp. NPDC047038]|uniref:hypothetical protein n=1 Tax=Nocardia sp. NPDC047038 TaxID=3154338 RepID=UPI0033DEF779